MIKNLFHITLGLVVLASLGCEPSEATAGLQSAGNIPVSTTTPAPSPPTPAAPQTPPPELIPASTLASVPELPLHVTPEAIIPASCSNRSIPRVYKTRTRSHRNLGRENVEYRPNLITVPVGTTVTWISKDCEGHDVTSDDGLFDYHIVQGESFKSTLHRERHFLLPLRVCHDGRLGRCRIGE